MNKEEAINELKEIIREAGDTESDHAKADDVLCDLLTSLGILMWLNYTTRL